MKRISFIIVSLLLIFNSRAQNLDFYYSIDLKPVSINGLGGLHSYAFAQHEGKWLIFGGRKDGIHARQPFNAFPQTENNTDILVIDPANQQYWSASLMSLDTNLHEQLQSTNMNFYQDEDSLYIIGGYAFSNSAQDHVTFDALTSVNVPMLIDSIINGNTFTSCFKQINDTSFAITGGQLGKIGDTFYLIGGHKFDGRYNPMGNNTYVQQYSNQIRKFKINNSGSQLSISNYSVITDPVHLRRRDYNLLPQVFPDGSEGYMISSGVFQANIDLPFLYPVEIRDTGYTPLTSFNQYLSNYHSAKACLYDSLNQEMHTLFFGGLSQYYYQNGTLIQDDNVPFVKTISRLSRGSNGVLQEFQMPEEMPNFKGAGAEFIPNNTLPHFKSEIIKLDQIHTDTIMIGHIYGGILSSTENPFTDNNVVVTSADNSIYEVRLIKSSSTNLNKIDGENPYDFSIYPNPTKDFVKVEYEIAKGEKVYYLLTNEEGKLIEQGTFKSSNGKNKQTIQLQGYPAQIMTLTLNFDGKFSRTKNIILTSPK